MTSRRRSASSSGGGFGAVIVVLIVVAIIVRFIWVILAVAAIAGSVYLARAILRDNRRRREEYDRYCAQIAANADQQDDWVAEGDPRGVFGPDGARLMDYLRSEGTASAPGIPVQPAGPVPAPLSRARQAAVPAVVAGGVGVALLLGQLDPPGSETHRTPSTPTPTPTYTQPSAPALTYYPPPIYRPTPTPTPTAEPTPTDVPTPTAEPTPTYVPEPTYAPTPTYASPAPIYAPPLEGTYYRNCKAAHADGRYNIPRGDPSYRPGLDRDGDGFACE